MVRYNKKYGDPFNNVFTWGAEMLLGFIYQKSSNYIYKFQNKKGIHDELDNLTQGQVSGRQVSNMLYELKRRKYIETCEDDEERAIKLTNKAKIKIIERIIENEPFDKRYRFVSFDIPERLHYNRDMFRRVIKRMGFRQIQQSLWVTNKNIGEMVEVAAKEYKVEEYVAYIVSDKTNIDQHVEEVLKH